jgi:hypothetical protein
VSNQAHAQVAAGCPVVLEQHRVLESAVGADGFRIR